MGYEQLDQRICLSGIPQRCMDGSMSPGDSIPYECLPPEWGIHMGVQKRIHCNVLAQSTVVSVNPI